MNNGYFTAAVSFQDGGTWRNKSSGVALFESSNASSEHAIVFPPAPPLTASGIRGGLGGVGFFEDGRALSEQTLAFSSTPLATPARITADQKVSALSFAGTLWATNLANQAVLKQPVLTPFLTTVPDPQAGRILFSLEKDFLHSTYRKKYVENVMSYSKNGTPIVPNTTTPVILNEPYAPTVQTITLSYTAHSDAVNIASNSLDDFANGDIQFFQIACFGQMREHRYQREHFEFLSDKQVHLLPVYENEGELLIGLSDLNAGDSVNLLFQVAEGSADPGLTQEAIDWFVLCDNYWKPLTSSEVLFDTTNQLLKSGTIQFVIPTEATLVNTILPAGQIWIKAAVKQNVTAICQMIEVAANAVEVQFTNNNNDPIHLLTALESGTIAKLKNGLSAVKSVKQPYASFGGRPVETDARFYTRASERLRHKNRCITPWDYERVILEAFPKVHTVKCIPHAKEGDWLAPGHVLIVVTPDLKNKNAVDPLQPRVDADTLSQITSLVKERVGMQVTVMVKNPVYQQVQLDFKVKFHAGYEFNYYSGLVNQAVIQFLSPWAFDAEGDMAFGGKVYRSVLLDFVEEMEYVDYVTDFKMYSDTGGIKNDVDLNEIEPKTPDAILVSAAVHTVLEVAEEKA